jgi:hypothetical protein
MKASWFLEGKKGRNWIVELTGQSQFPRDPGSQICNLLAHVIRSAEDDKCDIT